MILKLPIEIQVVAFDVASIGEQQAVGDVTVRLAAASGSEALIRYSGPLDRYLIVLKK